MSKRHIVIGGAVTAGGLAVTALAVRKNILERRHEEVSRLRALDALAVHPEDEHATEKRLLEVGCAVAALRGTS